MSSGCDYTLEDSVYLLFTTRAFATGIPGTLSTSTVSVYEDVTATPVLDDVAVTESLNSVAGLNAVTIAATAANGFNVGGAYHVVIKTGTVDSVSVVGEVVGNFTVGHSAAAVDLANGTDGLTALKSDTAAILDDTGTNGVLVSDGTGAGQIALTAGAIDTVTDVTNLHASAATSAAQTTAQNDLDLITGSDGATLATAQALYAPSKAGDAMTLTAAATSAQLVDDVWDEVNTTGAHNTTNSTGKQLREGTGALVITSGTCQAAGQTTTNVRLAAGESSTNDIYNHKRIVITAGTNVGFDAIIADYDGTNKDCTITPALPSGCDNTSEYEITPAIVHSETQGGGYADGAVWVGPSGSTGTQLYVDGTVDNPIDDGSWANVLTVAVALNIQRVHVIPGSAITFGAAVDQYTIMGNGYSIALGGQSVNGTIIEGATITGNDDGANTTASIYKDCLMGTSTLGLHRLDGCGLSGTLTFAEAGTYDWVQCHSRVAGTGSPSVTFAAGNQNLNMRRYSGGIQVEAMGASASTDTMSLEGNGQFIEGTCTAGTVAIRGNFTISGITNLTLSDDARLTKTEISDQVWIEQIGDHSGVSGSTAEQLAAAGAGGDPWATTLPAAYTAGQAGGILGDWINTGRLDTILDTIATDTTTDIPALIGTAQADLDTITGSDGVTLATAQALYAPNVVVPDAAGVAPTAAEIVDEWEAQSQADPTGFHVNLLELNSSSAQALIMQQYFKAMTSATADSGSTTTIVDTELTEGDTDYFDENTIVVFTTGTIKGQARRVVSFNPATDTITFTPAVTQAVTNNAYLLIPDGKASLLAATQASIDAIETDTNELQGDWTDGGRLDLLLDAIPTTAMRGTDSAATSAKQDTMETTLNAITAAGPTKAEMDTAHGLLATPAQVNTEVLDVLTVDTFAEPTGVPAATATLGTKIGTLYMALRNKVTVTATKKTFYDDGDAAEFEKDLSDDGTTYTETETNAI